MVRPSEGIIPHRGPRPACVLWNGRVRPLLVDYPRKMPLLLPRSFFYSRRTSKSMNSKSIRFWSRTTFRYFLFLSQTIRLLGFHSTIPGKKTMVWKSPDLRQNTPKKDMPKCPTEDTRGQKWVLQDLAQQKILTLFSTTGLAQSDFVVNGCPAGAEPAACTVSLQPGAVSPRQTEKLQG